jgi:hypothetical protein
MRDRPGVELLDCADDLAAQLLVRITFAKPVGTGDIGASIAARWRLTGDAPMSAALRLAIVDNSVPA